MLIPIEWHAMKKNQTPIAVLTGIAAVIVLLLFVRAAYLPTFGAAQYRLDGTDMWQDFQPPLSLWNSRTAKADFRMTIILRPIHPSVYRILHSDVLHQLTINGVRIAVKHNDESLDLADTLHVGDNVIEGTVESAMNHPFLVFQMTPTLGNDISYFLVLAITSLCAVFAWMLTRHLMVSETYRWLPSITALGVALRVLYGLCTSYWSASYDWQGHQ